MRWILPNGKFGWVSDRKYRVDYDKPSRSKQQFQIKQFLKIVCPCDIIFEEYPLPGTRLKVDLLNATRRWAIEHQGVGHNAFNKFFHVNRLRYRKAIVNDARKYEILQLNKYVVIETFPEDLPLTKEWFVEKYNIYL